MKTVKFTVKGAGPFPTDMLRYDRCFPADTDSSIAMAETPSLNPEFYKERRFINLVAIERVTEGRWNSFGWHIVKQKRS